MNNEQQPSLKTWLIFIAILTVVALGMIATTVMLYDN